MKGVKSVQKAGWLLVALALVLGLVVQNAVGQTAGGTIRQWASTAIASSEYSSTGWSAAQAAGAPNTFAYGDINTAWTTLGADEGIQWIELNYNIPVYAEGVNLHETYNPGALTRIDLKDTNGVYYTAWTGTDPGAGITNRDAWSNISFEQTIYLTNTVKVYIDTNVPGWNEIDAIELIGESTTISGPGVTPSAVTPSPSSYILSATPTTVLPGQKITVTFTAPGYQQDWIAMYAITAKNENYGEYYYLGEKTSGTLTFTAPSQEGEYEFRMFQNWPTGGYNDIARSNKIRVNITSTSSTAELSYIGSGEDKVGTYTHQPDGTGDGHFRLRLHTQAAKTLTSLKLESADANDQPASGQFWNTVPDGLWILGVHKSENGAILNPTDSPITDTITGEATYDLYAETSGYFNNGQHFIVTAVFSDGSTEKAATVIGATSSAPTATTTTTTTATPSIPTTIPVSKKCTGTEPYLYIEDRTMNKGNTVEIPIMMCNADNLANMDLTLNYDTSILKIKDITKGSLNQRAVFDWNEVSTGRLKISFAVKEEVSGSGSIAVMIFDVLGNKGATALIGGTVTTASKTGGITISVRVIPGTFTVGTPTINGDCNGDTKLDERDVLAALQMAVEKRAVNMCYDYNKDGKVDSSDARDMLKAVVREGG
ncbi:MAG: cohesin domain-containing protein [Candidatus Methanoperedens sp.]|nr:cohesin domain-containing protein [Candidatus Methanoperedens sp.]CAG0991961.1 hypothetical protein METP1_02345 [Methanosarcinales archaeon]